jgi:alkylation response protein AidB-like acyl-CoA dehydrogenase
LVADAVVGLVGAELVVAHADHPPPLVRNHGGAPLASWDLTGSDVTTAIALTGPTAIAAFEDARREWMVLMAAAQVGIAEGAITLALDFARNRVAFGAPIGSFQAVSHPLVDCHIAIVGARRLMWKAAWYADHEPDRERQLIPMAFTYACHAAIRAATVGVHTQGGLGFTSESDMQLFFRRAKGWANIAGDPNAQLGVIADALYGPVGS